MAIQKRNNYNDNNSTGTQKLNNSMFCKQSSLLFKNRKLYRQLRNR